VKCGKSTSWQCRRPCALWTYNLANLRVGFHHLHSPYFSFVKVMKALYDKRTEYKVLAAIDREQVRKWQPVDNLIFKRPHFERSCWLRICKF
jgi:hypothetical protein